MATLLAALSIGQKTKQSWSNLLRTYQGITKNSSECIGGKFRSHEFSFSGIEYFSLPSRKDTLIDFLNSRQRFDVFIKRFVDVHKSFP